MGKEETILRFDQVSFGYEYGKPILDVVDFSLRRGLKVALMGQNGAGKTTIFQLITWMLQPDSGEVHVGRGVSVATARQVIPREQLDLSILDFFRQYAEGEIFQIKGKIKDALEVVHLEVPLDRVVKKLSGGQQARLLLASALIQDPDLLLPDEPTNNLDKVGIEHLTQFLVAYQKTCIVISHDSDFLNAFTDVVLYLDVHTHKVERYLGNYFDVVKEIALRIEKENMKNAQLAKTILENKEKANFFAHKGGKMRLVAKRMRTKAAELEEEMVDVRKEAKAIRHFIIPAQPELVGKILHISSYTTMKNHEIVSHKVDITLNKRTRLLLVGPNGIGKTTLLEVLASGKSKGAVITEGVKVGYYRQDFSTLNFEDTVYDSLMSVMDKKEEEHMRSVAAGFLITADQISSKIGSLSEGQKGLVAFARLVLQKPGLLILDEPTNHINFRHLPVIAKALDQYEGAVVLVSHVADFVEQIKIDQTLDLER